MTRAVDSEKLETEIAALANLGCAELRKRYKALTGDPAPAPIERELLLLAVSYEVQRLAHRSEGRCNSLAVNQHRPAKAGR